MKVSLKFFESAAGYKNFVSGDVFLFFNLSIFFYYVFASFAPASFLAEKSNVLEFHEC